jgi:uncharacterized membrane protein
LLEIETISGGLPMTHRTAHVNTADAAPRPRVRSIGVGDMTAALRQGYADFLAKPSHLIFVGVFYPLFGIVLGLSVFSDGGAALVFPLVSGFALVGPVAAVPLYEVSRRREAGLDASWRHALGALTRPGVWSIVLVAILLCAVFAAWIASAQAIYAAIYGPIQEPSQPMSFWAFLGDVVTTARGWTLILVGHAVGFVFAAVAFTLGVVSLPLLVDRDVGAGVAVRTSIEAVRRNPRPMAAWAAIVAGLLVLGSAPLLVGLTVVMPILGHATWHVYRRVIDPQSVGGTPRRG